jgi:hypothetical protein
MKTSSLAKIDFNANKGGDTGADNALTRTGIQYGLAPMIAQKLSSLIGYDPMNNVAHARRTLRAMMTIALQPLLHMGAPKKFMREQLIEALDNALKDHAENFKAKAAKALPSSNKGGGKLLKWK